MKATADDEMFNKATLEHGWAQNTAKKDIVAYLCGRHGRTLQEAFERTCELRKARQKEKEEEEELQQQQEDSTSEKGGELRLDKVEFA